MREPTQDSNQPKRDGSTFDPTTDRNEKNRDEENWNKKPKATAEIQENVNRAHKEDNQKGQDPQSAERK